MRKSWKMKLAGLFLGAVVLLTGGLAQAESIWVENSQNYGQGQGYQNYQSYARGQVGPVYLYCRASEYATLRQTASVNAAALTRITSRGAVTYLGISGDFYYVSYNGMTGYVLQEFFSLDPEAPINTSAGPSSPSTSPAPVNNTTTMYCCASEYVHLRRTASRNSDALATVGSREAVSYISTSGDFYYVSYRGINGYVLKEFFSTDINAPLNYGSGGVDSSSPSYGTLYCCASEAATLRSIASRSGDALAMVQSRQAVEYMSTVGEFYQVRFNGQVGYVLAAYFSSDPNAPLNYGTN